MTRNPQPIPKPESARPLVTLPTAAEDAELLNRRQAAAVLNVSPASLALWASKGEGPDVVQLSPRRVAYRLQDLLDFAAARVIKKGA